MPDDLETEDAGANSTEVPLIAHSPAPTPPYRPVSSAFLRGLLVGCGWLSVTLGAIGIILPVMPTTPFLLLAAACFIRSSKRFYDWLVGHSRLGPYLTYYLDGKGMPYRAKLYTLLLMWCSMAFSAWLVGSAWASSVMIVSGVGVSVYISRIPVRSPPAK